MLQAVHVCDAHLGELRHKGHHSTRRVLDTHVQYTRGHQHGTLNAFINTKPRRDSPWRTLPTRRLPRAQSVTITTRVFLKTTPCRGGENSDCVAVQASKYDGRNATTTSLPGTLQTAVFCTLNISTVTNLEFDTSMEHGLAKKALHVFEAGIRRPRPSCETEPQDHFYASCGRNGCSEICLLP